MLKSRFSNYNDGIVYIVKKKPKSTDFNAAKNALSRDDLEEVVKLAYEEKSKRDEDIEFASSQGRTLSFKIKTRSYKVDPMLKAIVGDTLYSIIKLDHDRAKQEMYIYLEEERKLSDEVNT